MPRAEFDLVVIGGGAGGLVVAAGAAKLGAKVALVEKSRLGGDCLWHGCVPSKALLKAAHVAHAMQHAQRYGLPANPAPADLALVMEHVAGVVGAIAPHDSPERFRSLGIDVVEGAGRFVAPDALAAAGRTLTARHFVIATGSRPWIPPVPGLARTPYLTNETVFAVREPVPRLLIVGAGAIGCELAQAFRRLGSEVTVIDVAPRILVGEDPDVAAVVHAQLVDDGVRFHLSSTIRGVRGDTSGVAVALAAPDGETSVDGTHLLVAAGRRPDVEELCLAQAGVDVHDGSIVRTGLRTTNRRIFVIGDAAGGGYTHVAEHHAAIVLRQALFRQAWARESAVVPRCTFTEPEVAQVGLSETDARARAIKCRTFVVPFDAVDRAHTDVETAGFAKLLVDPRGRLLGAAIVGPRAGDLIAECTLAISKRLEASDLSAAMHAYPTFAQIVRRAADQQRNARLTPRTRSILKRLFALRGP